MFIVYYLCGLCEEAQRLGRPVWRAVDESVYPAFYDYSQAVQAAHQLKSTIGKSCGVGNEAGQLLYTC